MKQSNIFKPTLKFSQKTSVSNVNVSNDNFRLSSAMVKFDSTVARNRTIQIIHRGHIHLQNNHIKCALHIVSHTWFLLIL